MPRFVFEVLLAFFLSHALIDVMYWLSEAGRDGLAATMLLAVVIWSAASLSKLITDWLAGQLTDE